MIKKQTEKKYNFVYQTKNLINGKTYIGVHTTDKLNDGYIGCGISSQGNSNRKGNTSPFIKAVRKYGYSNFVMIPLCFFDTAEEAYEEEAWLVDEKWVGRKDTYNVTLGGNVNRQYKGSLSRENHGFSKKVINKSTGQIFDSITTVSELLGINKSTLTNKLNGRCFNDTDYELVKKPEGADRVKSPNGIKYTNIQRFDLSGNLLKTYKRFRELDNTTRVNVLRTIQRPDLYKIADGCLWRIENIYTKEVLGFGEDVFRFKLYKNNELSAKFVKVTDMLDFLNYSHNSRSRVLEHIRKGKEIKGYKIYDNQQKTS